MTAKTVWLLEEYDIWFSANSRILFGIFTTREKAIKAIFENYSEKALGVKNIDLYENGTNQWKSDTLNCGINIREIKLNNFEEV